MQQGLYRWFLKNLRGRKGQQGFTLIELLVVVTILGILAAIVTLSLVGLTSNATSQSCNAEYRTVQSALDTYIAATNAPGVSAENAWTNDMSGGNGSTYPGNTNNGTVPLFVSNPGTNYTRNGTTQFFYKWDASGKIFAIASDTGGTQVNGCAPK
jgi:prepilin-type N-terminal cleavage/methylation domain-containing protein